MPNFNIHFETKCKVHKKILEAKKIKNKKSLSRVFPWHSAKVHGVYHRLSLPSAMVCRVSGTRQRASLPSAELCRASGTRQRAICRVQHSAKKLFAECPSFSTRQSI